MLESAPDKSAGGALIDWYSRLIAGLLGRGSRTSQARRQLAAVSNVVHAHSPMADFAATRRVAHLMLLMV